MSSVQETATLKAALNILRKTPASDTVENYQDLEKLLSPNPDALYEFMQHIHVPLLSAAQDAKSGRPYILSSYNRLPDGTYRSPSTPMEDDKLFALQTHANELWDTYVNMYYGKNAVGSVYLSPGGLFSGCFLLQNKTDAGEWNSVHVVTVSPTTRKADQATYHIHSTVYISVQHKITAHVNKNISHEAKKTSAYMETIGPLLEETEKDLRSSLERVHLPKTRDIVESIRQRKRPPSTMGMNHTAMLNQAVLARMQKKG